MEKTMLNRYAVYRTLYKEDFPKRSNTNEKNTVLVILRNLIQGWNGIVSHTTQSVMLRKVNLSSSKNGRSKKNRRAKGYNQRI